MTIQNITLSRQYRLGALALAVLMPAAPAAHAEDWPAKNIRLVVSASAGGGTDQIARLIAQFLSKDFKPGVHVENRAGADELIGADNVARSAPDGYSILMTSASVSVNPALRRKMPYATQALQPVALLATLPYVILVNPKLPVKTVADLVDYSHKQPKGISLASAGSSNLLASQSFRLASGADIAIAQYMGCAPAVMDVASGVADFTICSAPAAAPLITAGKLHAVAVTGDKRLGILPDVPTTKEFGQPKYQVDLVQWVGMFVPAGTPRHIVSRLNSEINQALAQPEIIERIRQLGGVAAPESVDQFTRFFNNEVATAKQIVKEAHIPTLD